jgi:hypothetical protein
MNDVIHHIHGEGSELVEARVMMHCANGRSSWAIATMELVAYCVNPPLLLLLTLHRLQYMQVFNELHSMCSTTSTLIAVVYMQVSGMLCVCVCVVYTTAYTTEHANTTYNVRHAVLLVLRICVRHVLAAGVGWLPLPQLGVQKRWMDKQHHDG